MISDEKKEQIKQDVKHFVSNMKDGFVKFWSEPEPVESESECEITDSEVEISDDETENSIQKTIKPEFSSSEPDGSKVVAPKLKMKIIPAPVTDGFNDNSITYKIDEKSLESFQNNSISNEADTLLEPEIEMEKGINESYETTCENEENPSEQKHLLENKDSYVQQCVEDACHRSERDCPENNIETVDKNSIIVKDMDVPSRDQTDNIESDKGAPLSIIPSTQNEVYKSDTVHDTLNTADGLSQASVAIAPYESEAHIEVNTEVKTETSPSAKIGANIIANVDANVAETVEAIPRVNAEVHAEANPTADIDTNPKANVDATPETNVNVAPETNVNATPDVNVNANPETYVNATPDANVDAYSEANVNVAPETNVNATPDASHSSDPGANQNLGPHMNVDGETAEERPLLHASGDSGGSPASNEVYHKMYPYFSYQLTWCNAPSASSLFYIN